MTAAPPAVAPTRILIVTGMSGAGKSSALKALEDLGYEAVDNMPFSLLAALLATPDDMLEHGTDRPLAVGVDARTRGFDAERVIEQLKHLRVRTDVEVSVLFLDSAGDVLAKRYSETRRRHPLALDRPVSDGIAREREILAPLRRWADFVFDTSAYSPHDLKRNLAETFKLARQQQLTLTVMSFGFARGMPRDADLVFDMRFVSNPHWVTALQPMNGQDAPVAAYVEADPAFSMAFKRIEDLVVSLLPSYLKEGKSYLTVAFGCTGGKHRSVYAAEKLGQALKGAGYPAVVSHRDLRRQATAAEQAADLALEHTTAENTADDTAI
jgi:RNase adapter protein RapZ